MSSPFHDSGEPAADAAVASNPFAAASASTAAAGYQSGAAGSSAFAAKPAANSGGSAFTASGGLPGDDAGDDDAVPRDAEQNFVAQHAGGDGDDLSAGSPPNPSSLADEKLFLPAVPGSPDVRRATSAGNRPAPYGLSSVYAQHAGAAAGSAASAVGGVDPTSEENPAMAMPVTRLYLRRWFALSNFAILAIMNNVVCYSLAPVATLANSYYETDIDLSMLITVFFVTYVLFSFPSSHFIEKHGLRAGLVVGSWAQAIGTVLRCFTLQSVRGSGFGMVMFGQVIASLGQAFFINTPPLVASTWFGEQERTLATTIACNADAFGMTSVTARSPASALTYCGWYDVALGIAISYILSPAVVANDQHNIPLLLQGIAVTSVFMASITTILFPEDPPLPPSRAQYMKLHAPKPPPESWGDRVRILQRKGFVYALIAFAVSETTVNAFATFMDYMLERFSSDFVSYMGSAFIVSGLIGSSILGTLVDKYHWYKSMVVLAFVGSALSLLFFCILSMSDTPEDNPGPMAAAILLVGFWVTPLLPITIEVAVEVAYPVPESSTAAMQQVAGNLLSSTMIPLLMLLRNPETESFAKANWVLLGFILATGLFFVFFNGQYLRLRAEERHGQQHDGATSHDHAALPSNEPNLADVPIGVEPAMSAADASTPFAAR